MKINISRKGAGDLVLVLHGWGASTKSWERVQKHIADYGYHVVVPDMPGFGESDHPPKAWSLDDYLRWLVDFLKSDNLKTPLHVVGHSFGGGLAMQLAIRHPELVKSLTLVAAARTKNKKSLYKKILSKVSKVGKVISFLPFFPFVRKIFYRFIVREGDYVRTTGVMRDTIRLILKEDLTPVMHKIKSPTLIVWGDKDKSTPLESAHLIHREIKGSKLEIVTGAGHALNLETPEKLSELIYKFIKSI